MAIGREAERKILHLGAGVAVAILVFMGILLAWHLAIITAAGFIVSLATRKRRLPVIGWLLSRVERHEVMSSFPGRGAFFFFSGALISAFLFPQDIAAASIMVLAIGDSVSPLVSMRMGLFGSGSRRHPRAITAGFVFSVAGAWAFVPLPEAFVAAAAGIAVEYIDSVGGWKVEDNVTIPVAAGLAAFLLRMLS